VRAKRNRDLNRLLDKPGLGERAESQRTISFRKLPWFFDIVEFFWLGTAAKRIGLGRSSEASHDLNRLWN
jgi:hypothetical protein